MTWTRRQAAALMIALAALAGAGRPALPQAPEGPVPYHKLTWHDFRVDDQIRSNESVSAHTAARISYHYRSNTAGRGGNYTALVTQVQILSGFDPSNSWRRSHTKSDPAQLLQHEQGHLDINEIKANALRQLKLNLFPVGRGATAQAARDDLRRNLQIFFDAQLQEVRQQQARYDQETEHGKQAQKQNEWNQAIKQALQPAGGPKGTR
jgi:hypothetical protein